MDKILEKKGLGRSVGTWETKRKQYSDMKDSPRTNYYSIKGGDDGTSSLND